MINCPLCYKQFTDVSEFERHLKEFHYLDMYQYYEMMKFTDSISRPPISYLTPSTEMYLPNLSKAKSINERNLFTNLIKENLREYYSNIIGDRFFQLFIIDDVYFNNTLSHQYEEFKDIIRVIQKRDDRDRSEAWFLDWILGYPRIISNENIDGIKTVRVDQLYSVDTSQPDKIIVNNYIINLPELLNMNYTNYPKYNIFSNSKGRNTRRLKLDPKKRPSPYLKFYPHKGSEVQSILQITDSRTGEPVDMDRVPKLDLIVLKLLTMRSRSYMKLLCEVLEVVCDSVNLITDGVFLRNSVEIDPKKNHKVNLSWLPSECSMDEEFINISIF